MPGKRNPEQESTPEHGPETEEKPTQFILIVDDDPIIRAFVGHAIQRALPGRFHILYAENTKQADNHLKEHKPAIIFLNHQMPGTDGFTWLQELRSSNTDLASTPVIFSTGISDGSLQGQVDDLGNARWLPKPFKHTELQQTIRQILPQQ